MRFNVEGMQTVEVIDDIPGPAPGVFAYEPAPAIGAFRLPWNLGKAIDGLGADPNTGEDPPRWQQYANHDSVPHNLVFALRGTGIPGGEILINTNNPVTVAGPGGLLTGNSLPNALVALGLGPNQRLELEQATNVATTSPTFAGQYLDVQARPDELHVTGTQWGNFMGAFGDLAANPEQNPLVLAGPPLGADFVREVFWLAEGPLASFVVNREVGAAGANNIDVVVTRLGPDPQTLINQAALVDGGTDLVNVPNVILLPGESLQILTNTVSNAILPFAFLLFRDQIR